MQEIFKLVDGYDYPYEISNYGNIKYPTIKNQNGTVISNEKITPGSISNGEYVAAFTKNGKVEVLKVSRLVAKYFISDERFNIRHIDGNKLNNHINNLEYIIPKQRYKNIGTRRKRKVMCVETGEIYDSVVELALKLQVAESTIRESCFHNRKTCGYHYKFITDAVHREWFNVDTGEIYPTKEQCLETLGISITYLQKRLKDGKWKQGEHVILIQDIMDEYSLSYEEVIEILNKK